MDEDGIITRNKERLVAQEIWSVSGECSTLEDIRLFIAYSSYKKFEVFPVNVQYVALDV